MNIRLEEHKLCLLVLIGVRADGRKELIALADGYRESAESWADLLRDCARRGMRAPVLAVGDGALGFWNGLREVFPETKEGRCWFHKTANVLAALPKSAHPGAKKALAEIWGAEDKDHALAAVKAFDAAYGAKFPKATVKITDDADEQLVLWGSRPGQTGRCDGSRRSAIDENQVVTPQVLHKAACPATAGRESSSDNERHTHGDVSQKLSAKGLVQRRATGCAPPEKSRMNRPAPARARR